MGGVVKLGTRLDPGVVAERAAWMQGLLDEVRVAQAGAVAGGGDLPKQADIFVGGGRQFYNLSQRSRLGIPSIAVVFGPSTAGGAYVPGMSDHVIMVEGAARVYLGGPPLVKMAIDEDAEE